MTLAWQTSEEDIEVACKVDNDTAQGILNDLNNDAVERAALNSSEMNEQIKYAYEEIRNQAREMGFTIKTN